MATGLSIFPPLNTRMVANGSLSCVSESSNSPVIVVVWAFIAVLIHTNANVSNVFFILIVRCFYFAAKITII